MTIYSDGKRHTHDTAGIGLVFAGSGIMGIDLDSCLLPDGGLTQEASDLLEIIPNSYIEVSPSGRGLHIYYAMAESSKQQFLDKVGLYTLKDGRKAYGTGRRFKTGGAGHSDIEVYLGSRYFAFTGQVFRGYSQLAEIDAEELSMAWGFLEGLERDKRPQGGSRRQGTGQQRQGTGQQRQGTGQPENTGPRDNDQLLQRARRSRSSKMAGMIRLYDTGDCSQVGGDESRADFCLMCFLCYITAGDSAEMERLFSNSALGQREKWVKRPDYRQDTIQAALNAWDGKSYEPDKFKTKKAQEKAAHTAEWLEACKSDPDIIQQPKWPVEEYRPNTGELVPSPGAWQNVHYLMHKLGIGAGLNLLTKQVDFSGHGLERKSFEVACADIRTLAIKNGLRIGNDDLSTAVRRIAEIYKASPVLNFLGEARRKWDGTSRLDELFACLKLDPEAKQDPDLLKLLFRRWLISCAVIAANANDAYENQACQGVLVLCGNGRQGIGKSRFLYSILPTPEWGADGISIGGESKDELLVATKAWICELGELGESMSSKRLQKIKRFITRKEDILRLPYGRETRIFPRITAYMGTTDVDRFLTDTAGERRWWIIRVNGVDNERAEQIDKAQLWGEVAHLAEVEPHYLTADEIARLNSQNEQYKAHSAESQLLEDSLDWEAPTSLYREVTASALCDELGLPASRAHLVGQALKAMAAHESRIGLPKNHKARSYLLPPLTLQASAAWQERQGHRIPL